MDRSPCSALPEETFLPLPSSRRTRISKFAAYVLSSDKARFLVVGGFGFAFEAVTLHVLTQTIGVHAWAARALSFPTAVVLTWYCNRLWTFASNDPGRLRQFLKYAAVQGGSGILNVAAYMVVVGSSQAKGPADVLVGLAAGSALGLLTNYVGSRWLVFVKRSSQSVPSG